MKTTLHERLIRAEQQFLLAVVSNDEESLKAFSQKWSQLAHDIENIKAVERLDDHTAHLLFKVSRAIESTTLCMLECRAISEELLTHSIGGFIQDVPLDDRFIPPLHSQAIAPRHLIFSDLPYSKIPKILGQQKVLDSYAYSWLMQNIHEPYPNSVQTRIISDASGFSVAQVEHWFQEVRDSIGWRKLSHKFFAGSVAATVAAARRVYIERDKNVSFEIVFAFTAVKANAEILFPELPPLQGKDVDMGSVQTDQTMAMGQDHYTWPLLDNSIIDPESILVPPQVNILASHDLSDLSDSDGSEEEDTTPPPPIAGFKRLLTEDVFTGQEADLGRPQKRLRTTEPMNWTPPEPECSPILSSTSSLSSKQAAPTMLVLPSPSLHTLSPTSPETFPGPSPSVPQKRGCMEIDEATLEDVVSLVRAHVSAPEIRKRRLSQCVSPTPSKRPCRLSIPPCQHSPTDPTPSFDGHPNPSPQDIDPQQFLQPTLQAPVNTDTPVDLSVFDWNSFSDPLAGTAPSISQPAIVYVSGSDLPSQLLKPPGLGHDATTTSSSSSDLGSLQDFSSLLQFPVPAGPPDFSALIAPSIHPDDSSLIWQDLDWSTTFINPLPHESTQSSSPLSSSSDPPTPPDNSTFPSSQTWDASEQPLSQLDPSVSSSAFLPFELGAFTKDVNNMYSLLPGEYSDTAADALFRAAC